MKIFILIFILALVFSTVDSRINVCRTGVVVNRPVNGQPYYFPSYWNENQTAPDLARDQSCSWIVTIPKGYYAKLIISGKMGDNVSHFDTVDHGGNFVQTSEENMEPYYFPTPKFTLALNNEAPATFGFKILWAPFPNFTIYDQGVALQPYVFNITDKITTADFASTVGVSIFGFPADYNNYYSLRSVMVFDGKNPDAAYVNNLYELYKAKNQFVSGKNIYLANVEARHAADKIMVQDAMWTSYINPYKQLDCAPSSTCTQYLDGGNSYSGFAYFGYQNQTLVDIQMDKNSTLTVYYGSPCPYDTHDDYSGSTIHSKLPLKFKPGSTHYVIDSGKSTFTFKFSDD